MSDFQQNKKLNLLPLPYIGMYDLDLIYQTSDVELLYQILSKVNEIAQSQNIIIDNFEKILDWALNQIEKFTKEQLEEWLNNGTLENMILSLGQIVKYIDTTIEMIKDTTLQNNQLIQTKGYEYINDGGIGLFVLTDIEDNEHFQFRCDNGLYATILNCSYIEAYGITNDLTSINQIKGLTKCVLMPKKAYVLNETTIENIDIIGDDSTININGLLTLKNASNKYRNSIVGIKFVCSQTLLNNMIIETLYDDAEWGGTYYFEKCQFINYNYTCVSLKSCFNVEFNQCAFFSNDSPYSVALYITNKNGSVTPSSFSNVISINNSWLNGATNIENKQGTLIYANDCVELNIYNTAIELAECGIYIGERLQKLNLYGVWFEQLKYAFNKRIVHNPFGNFVSFVDEYIKDYGYNVDNGFNIMQFKNADTLLDIKSMLNNELIPYDYSPCRITFANKNNSFYEIKNETYKDIKELRPINELLLKNASFGNIFEVSEYNNNDISYLAVVTGYNGSKQISGLFIYSESHTSTIFNSSENDEIHPYADYIQINNLTNPKCNLIIISNK